MKLKCIFTGHRWHMMPWLKERRQPGVWFQMPGPKKACLECGRLKYDYVLFIPSIESGLGPHFEYEGQWLRDYSSYAEFAAARKKAREELLSMIREKRNGHGYS